MHTINTLAQYFSRFPGIGPRQSKRFVFFLLRQDSAFLRELAGHIAKLKDEIAICPSCFRFMEKKHGTLLCDVCASESRDDEILMVVEKDVDLDAFEKAGVYTGRYFVLGGSIPILEKSDTVRIKELLAGLPARIQKGLKEIIIATSLTTEGEHTGDEVQRALSPIAEQNKLRISHLGRGLSTGTEIEYSDNETIKNAFKNRA